MVQNKPESNEVDGDSIATTWEEAFYWKKNLRRVKEPSNFSRTQNFGSSLPLSPLFPLLLPWSRLLIPLTYARVVVLAMRVAGIRSGGALGKIRDPNYWDDPPNPSRFPSATRMKSIYRRKRYMPRASFLSNELSRADKKKKKPGSLGRREKPWYWMDRKSNFIL